MRRERDIKHDGKFTFAVSFSSSIFIRARKMVHSVKLQLKLNRWTSSSLTLNIDLNRDKDKRQ